LSNACHSDTNADVESQAECIHSPLLFGRIPAADDQSFPEFVPLPDNHNVQPRNFHAIRCDDKWKCCATTTN